MLLPKAQGTYVLIAYLARTRRLTIGRLGVCRMASGFYAYVGSAFGSGGLRARLRHHLGHTTRPHWHLDYLLAHAEVVEIWYAPSDHKQEQGVAEVFQASRRFQIPVPGFGASDYRDRHASHLFYSKGPPSFRQFAQTVSPAETAANPRSGAEAGRGLPRSQGKEGTGSLLNSRRSLLGVRWSRCRLGRRDG
jgi:Uri superfamily endonuclease